MVNAEEMAALRERVKPGWKVKITDHDYLADSRDDVAVEKVTEDGLILRPRRPWGSQGRSFGTMHFTWDGDQAVTGNTVDLYHTPPPHTGKHRRLVKTFKFSEGVG